MIGIVFGVVVGKEIFGGIGMNFLNFVLMVRVFFYFVYVLRISGVNVWIVVDGYLGVIMFGKWVEFVVDGKWLEVGVFNMLGLICKIGEDGKLGEIVVFVDNMLLWFDVFVGNVYGLMGEILMFVCFLGVGILIMVGIGFWWIMSGLLIGMVVFLGLLYVFGSVFGSLNEMLMMLLWWYLVVGGFVFGMVYMVIDFVLVLMMEIGKWFYGVLIGMVMVMV